MARCAYDRFIWTLGASFVVLPSRALEGLFYGLQVCVPDAGSSSAGCLQTLRQRN